MRQKVLRELGSLVGDAAAIAVVVLVLGFLVVEVLGVVGAVSLWWLDVVGR